MSNVLTLEKDDAERTRVRITAVNPQSRRESIMYKTAAPINLGRPIKSYQSDGAGGRMVLFRLTFLRSSSADALVPGSMMMMGKMKQVRRREISRNRRRFDETSCQIFKVGEENDEGREEGRTGGVEKARKVSLGPAISRRLAILRCDIRAEKVAVSSRTLRYIRKERKNDENETLCESEEVIARRFLSRDIL